jgi:hypothetical protein
MKGNLRVPPIAPAYRILATAWRKVRATLIALEGRCPCRPLSLLASESPIRHKFRSSAIT